MEDLNDLAFFAKVVECKGFSAAGQQLGIPKSRLSRRIARGTALGREALAAHLAAAGDDVGWTVVL
jgi:hypothetical protein